MNWYWKARCYRPGGDYCIIQIKTERTLYHIHSIQNFYLAVIGERMLLEGMSEEPYQNLKKEDYLYAFLLYWGPKS